MEINSAESILRTIFKLLLFAFICPLLIAGCGSGPSGPTGQNGAPGANGASRAIDGNLIVCGTTSIQFDYPVQFCSNYQTTYSNSFPEWGLCIQGQLYAIIDQPNGYDYLALIVPGEYESEATNAVCTFTVKPNCQVIDD